MAERSPLVVARPARVEASRRPGERASRQAFLGTSALLFAAAAAGAVVWSASMSAMAGRGAMSMPWLPGPGQPWPVVAASFLGMWVVMTTAMMLPSLVPTLWRLREAMGRTRCGHPGRLAGLVGLGYFSVWAGFGAAAFPLGAALAVTVPQRPAPAGALPLAAGVVVLVAGGFQFTASKARHLACCREAPARTPAGAGAAWRQGLRLGLHCVGCCAGLMVVLLVIGVTDLRAMAVVAAVITAERLAPAGEHVARAIGVTMVGAGLLLVARAAGLG